jgi:filamentous hemagglutinin family protein
MKCDRTSLLLYQFSSLSALTIGLCLTVAIKEASAQSQLTPDRTLGAESSSVEQQPQPATDLITGGARRGQNLFHSFADFNVAPERSVLFSNPNGVTNILTRVTGNRTSQIESTLGVQGNANLFLINPNGITFGPEASLDVGGSFVATTANSIQFNQESFFRATSPEQSELLTIQPSAFFFNQNNSGQIANQSQALFGIISAVSTGAQSTTGLGVPEGKSLLLVGGNINLNRGGLNSVDGRVDIASVQAGQTLKINATDGELSLDSLPVAQAGDINLQQASITNAGSVDTTEGARRGLIRFQGKNLVLTDSSIRNSISNIPDPVEGNSTGVVLIADNIVLRGTSFSVAPFSSPGQSGNIFIEADRFTASESSLSTGAADQGTDGNITIKVRELLSLKDSRLDTESAINFIDSGQSGDIEISTRDFTAQNSDISTSTTGLGSGGNIFIDAQNKALFEDSLISSESNPSPAEPSADIGNAGDIEIKTNKLTSVNSEFSTSTSTQGNAGNITFKTADRLLLVDSSILSENFILELEEEVGLLSLLVGEGNAGNINISAKQLDSRNSFLSSTTFSQGSAGNLSFNIGNQLLLDDSFILSGALADTGRGGNINIQAQQLQATNESEISAATFGNGSGGNLNLFASESIELRSGSQLSVASEEAASGSAGDLEITTQALTIADGAQVTVSSPQAQAGTLIINASSLELDQGTLSAETGESVQEGANIDLQISQILTLSNESLISADAFREANGGNILIDSPLLLALPPEGPNGSDIIANAVDGQGGNINITTQGRFGIELRDLLTPLNDITASSSTNLPGEVSVQTSEVDPSDNIINLPIRPPEVKVVKSCSAQRGRSDFVVTGRGGIPPSAQEALSQDAFQVGLVTLTPEHKAKKHDAPPVRPTYARKPGQRLDEAQGWVTNANGQLTLIAAAAPQAGLWPQPDCKE